MLFPSKDRRVIKIATRGNSYTGFKLHTIKNFIKSYVCSWQHKQKVWFGLGQVCSHRLHPKPEVEDSVSKTFTFLYNKLGPITQGIIAKEAMCGRFTLYSSLSNLKKVFDEASESINKIHDRMPVILKPEIIKEWLNPATCEYKELGMILKHGYVKEIRTCPVSKFVNSPKNNDPRCIHPEISTT